MKKIIAVNEHHSLARVFVVLPIIFAVVFFHNIWGQSVTLLTHGVVAGAGADPSEIWIIADTPWSKSANGSLSIFTAYLLFYSLVGATGAYTITLDDSQNARNPRFQVGTLTISGSGGGIVTLGENGGITVYNDATAIIGPNTNTTNVGTLGVSNSGLGSLTLNGTVVKIFTRALNVNGGMLLLDFTSLVTPTDLINNGNFLDLGGSTLGLKGKSSETTSQTLGNVTVNTGSCKILGDNNGGAALNINLGTFTAMTSRGSVLIGVAGSAVNRIGLIQFWRRQKA